MQYIKKSILVIGVAALTCLHVQTAYAKGNLIARCKALPEQILGIDDAGFEVKESEYHIETGQCYKLPITSSGKHEYILEGSEFFSHIYIRKLEVGNMELGINSLRSIDFDDAVSSELYFLVVKPGKFEIVDRVLGDKGTRFMFVVE